MHVRKGDFVEIISGDDKKKRGKILAVDRKKNRVMVQGARMILKHIRRSQQHPQGVSNVMLVCEKTNKPSRIRKQVLADKTRVRVSIKSGEVVGTYGKPN
jgi:large subunit ribosomal protein L24